MTTTTLQIPISTKLKNDAEQKAKKSGYGSLEEVVRLFLGNFLATNPPPNLPTYTVDEATEKRIGEALKAHREGRYTHVRNEKELQEYLDDLKKDL